MNSTAFSQCPHLNIGMVLNVACFESIAKDLSAIESSCLRLVAVAGVRKSLSHHEYVEEAGIKVFDDYRDLLAMESLDMILECTGDEHVLSDIIKRKPPALGVVDRRASMQLIEMAKSYAMSPLASALLKASPDGVIVIDRELRIVECNQPSLIPGSANKGAIIGKHCFEVLYQAASPCRFPATVCVAREALKTGRPAREVYEISGPYNTSQFHQVTAYPIPNRQGEISQLVLTLRNITRQLGEKIEERSRMLKKDFAHLAQEDRLSSLGRLVASVCHEINNPITSIATFNRLVHSILQSKTGRDGPCDEEMSSVARYLDLAFQEEMRCGSIVKNLLTFARPTSLEAKSINLHDLVDTILLLTTHQLECANIRCEVHLPAGPFTAHGDYAQIQQCVLNLIFNAIDAMPHGGTLTISGEIDEGADLICLAVGDNGCGIDPKDLPKIFDPFYTTKSDGKGTGLGLAMVSSIIHEHHGDVEVKSDPGEGSTFTIMLPRKPVGCVEGVRIKDRGPDVLKPGQTRAKGSRP